MKITTTEKKYTFDNLSMVLKKFNKLTGDFITRKSIEQNYSNKFHITKTMISENYYIDNIENYHDQITIMLTDTDNNTLLKYNC